MNSELLTASSAIREAIKNSTQGLIERETLADLIILAAVASEHILIIGPPGTAKSAVVRRVANALGGRYFEYLLGRFTEPTEIFGPIDLRKLREGTIETETTDMLPEAEVAFLDEVFLGSTAILNTLLNLLNERIFRRGHTQLQTPLRVCVGASNALPEEESLAAFADRFLIHNFVDAVPDSMLENLLEGGWQASVTPVQKGNRLQQLDLLTQAAKQANLDQVRPAMSHCFRLLRKGGVELSDRRLVKSQMLIAAAAVIAGRENPDESDLWPIIYVIGNKEGQQTGRELLKDMLENAENLTLNAATEDAALSPAAIANRISDQVENLMRKKPQQATGRESEQWLLQIEALGREIDSVFLPDQLPERLKLNRDQIAALMTNTTGTSAEQT